MGRGWSVQLGLWLVLWSSQPVFAQQSAQQSEQASPPQVNGADQEARALFMAAQVAFDEGRFDSAVQYFVQSHRLSQRPELLYNIGNTYDRLQQPEQALEYFDQYLRERPNADNRLQVEARARLLRQSLAARQTSNATTAPIEPTVPTPEQTAQAHATEYEITPPAAAPPSATVVSEEGGSGWILWAGIGAAVVAATVVVVVLASSGGSTTQAPLVPEAGAPVVRL